MGVMINEKRQKLGSKCRFCSMKYSNFFWFFTELWSKKQLWCTKIRGHQVGFKIIPLFMLKFALADTGYIKVQYTKIKSALANRSSARVTARNPAVWREESGRGTLAIHQYDHVGSSPAWILLLRTSLQKMSIAMGCILKIHRKTWKWRAEQICVSFTSNLSYFF